MNDNNSKMGLLVAALLSLSQTTQAESLTVQNSIEEFAPLESLSADYRAMLHPQIEFLRKTIKIDWNSVAIGINPKGELVLKGREASKLEKAASPTCWAE